MNFPCVKSNYDYPVPPRIIGRIPEVMCEVECSWYYGGYAYGLLVIFYQSTLRILSFVT